MLKVITLHTLNKIFTTESQAKIGAMAKMVYISCVTHYFKDKEANVANCKSFELSKKDFDFNKSKKHFEELQRAGIVFINEDSVSFPNAWYNHIDKRQLARVDVNEFLGMADYKKAEDYGEMLRLDTGIIRLCKEKNRLPEIQVIQLIQDFIQEQIVLEKMYANITEAKRHCMSWINKKAELIKKEPTSKPKKKILGLD